MDRLETELFDIIEVRKDEFTFQYGQIRNKVCTEFEARRK